MPASTVEKACRMDVRLTKPQRAIYERAACLKGQTLSQWVTLHLDDCARRDIEESSKTVLDTEAFELFCEMLEAPMPEAASELLGREPIWA